MPGGSSYSRGVTRDAHLPPLFAVATLTTALLFACGDGGGDNGGGTTGSGGDTSSASSSDASSSSAIASSSGVTVASSSSGMSTFDCDPPAPAGSLYELEDIPMFPPKDALSMCQYRGEVLLIFNAAAI